MLIAGALPAAQTALAQTEYPSARADTVYPDFVSDLPLDAIDCYAINGDEFAFSREEFLYIYSGGTRTSSQDEEGNPAYIYEGGVMQGSADGVIYAAEHTGIITSLWYDAYSDADGDEQTVLFFADETGDVYRFDGSGTEPEQQPGTEQPAVEQIVTKNGLAYSLVNGSLSVTDFTDLRGEADFPAGTYSHLKMQDGDIYVLKDNLLCIIEGDTLEKVTVKGITFRYTDVTQAYTISVGNSATLLKEGGEVQFAYIPAGQYMTEVDLSDLSAEYFAIGEEGTFVTRQSQYALVLCTTGNADIVAIGGKAYITKSLSTRINGQDTAAPFSGGQLVYAAGIYSSPFMNEGTKLATLDIGSKVKISRQITAAGQPTASGVLQTDFCLATFVAEDGTQTTGYIATSFLTAYDFSAEDGDFTEPTLPEDYSEQNVILTVVLIIVIVVLVIAGVAYLSYSSGAGKRKKREGRSRDEIKTDEK